MSEMQNTKLADTVKTAMQKSANNGGSMTALKRSDLGSILEYMKPQIAQALPGYVKADQIIQMAVTLADRTPAIKECTPESFVGAVMQASILGFRPVAALGECYFVPYRNKNTGKREIQFQIGYKGYLSLARKSGEIKSLYAEVVRVGDVFDYELGLERKLVHKPSGNSDGEITHAYAVAHYQNGGFNFMVLSRSEIESYRKRSPAQGVLPSDAWKSDYDLMSKKTVIRRLAPYLPVSIERLQDRDIIHGALTDGAVIQPQDFMPDRSGALQEINNIEEAEIIDTPNEPEPAPEQEPQPTEPEIANPMFEQPKGKK
jgi:recombination protein RecT